MKYVYLYEILFEKENCNPLRYIGLRVCNCLPEQDQYMGSPKKYKHFWKNSSYKKTKKILKEGMYDTNYEHFRDEEVRLIKEAWSEYGYYGESGTILNATSGKAIHPFLLSGDNSPMKRSEVVNKVMQTRLEKYGPNYNSEDTIKKLVEASRRPDVIQKRIATLKKNRLQNPELTEIRQKQMYAAIGGEKSPNKRPERRKQNSDFQKKRIEDGTSPLLDPKIKQKAGESNKRRYLNDPSLRVKASDAAKERFAKNPEIRKRMSEARKKWYRDNPEKASLKNKKAAHTRFKKSKSTLEDFFA